MNFAVAASFAILNLVLNVIVHRTYRYQAKFGQQSLHFIRPRQPWAQSSSQRSMN